ncbi:phage portal protein [Altererythrobacter buctensis]|uniref:Phage portal protein n=2 Tax=Alteraurantiacibacter buctensis TaxID=1503981 RepID=A0A844Z5U3_9SPHN|nr:phage portal protein [Alteraurantiacibacter buctensis]
MVFTFGDPESVLDRRELSSYFEVWHNNRWFEPPLPMDTLARSFNMSAHHRSAIALKLNLLVSHLQPSRWLGADDFERFAIDFLQMGNGYLEWVPNMAGGLAQARVSLARHTRVGTKPGVFWFVTGPVGSLDHQFAPDSIFHLQQPDVAQEIYGLPEWLSALQAGLLNENATLFRRRYYLNGAHAGFILYLNEALADAETSKALEDRLKQAKGVGNFKNMLVHIPGGKKDGIQLLPIGEVAAKDEFASIKNISRDDLLAAHRVPPQLIGIIPQNNGGFGGVADAKDAFFEIEILPLARRMLRMNDWFGLKVLVFRNYVCANGDEIEIETGRRIPAAGAARR